VADWPAALQGARMETIGVSSSTSRGVTVTSGAADTKGSWTELSASTPFDADGFFLNLGGASAMGAGHANFLIDVGIGAAASEQVIVPDILHSGIIELGPSPIYIPIPIRAGTRVSVRAAGDAATLPFDCQIHLCAGGFFSALRLGRATSYGFVAGDTGGTEIDPGGTANTKGSWVQLVASLDNPICCGVLCLAKPNPVEVYADLGWLVDIGIGVAASEQVILNDVRVFGGNLANQFSPIFVPLFIAIKAGTRVAARAACSSIVAADRVLDIAILGFD